MTNDPVDNVISAYLDYLDGAGPEPTLNHLTPDERSLAKELIASLSAGRGIDPYQSRPSLNSLLADIGLEGWAAPPDTEGLTIDAVRADVVTSLGSKAELRLDEAALAEGLRSNGLVTIDGVRIRLQFRDDLSTPLLLVQVDPRAAGGPIYGRFTDTDVIVLLIGDEGFSSVPIGPFDVDDCIGAPDGETRHPRIHRPVLPLYDTLRACMDEFAPDLSAAGAMAAPAYLSIEDVARAEASGAIAELVDEGNKARTPAKTLTWGRMNGVETEFLMNLIVAIQTAELDSDEMEDRIANFEPAA